MSVPVLWNCAVSVLPESAVVVACPPEIATRDCIEIADPDLALVPGRGVARHLGGELGLLELAISRHAAVVVAPRQFEHRQVEAVKPGQGHELEPVSHAGDVALKACQLVRRQLLAPVEAGRTVVRQYL